MLIALRHTFANAITQTVRSNYKKNAKGFVAVGVNSKIRGGAHRALDFLNSGRHIVDFEETSFLFWIAAVFSEANLDFVAGEKCGSVWRLISRDHLKTKGLLIEGNRRLDIGNG